MSTMLMKREADPADGGLMRVFMNVHYVFYDCQITTSANYRIGIQISSSESGSPFLYFSPRTSKCGRVSNL